jgi:NAD(P)-dependent dehydrogenase (short-subunit alcohol dehydrogenase family)
MKPIDFKDLNNKIGVITGGGGVIGRSLAMALGSAGARIAIVDLFKDAADKVADEVSEKYQTDCIGIAANVLDKLSLFKAKDEINSKFGRIHFLINGAGGNHPTATTRQEFIDPDNLQNLEDTFFGLNLEGFRHVFDLNFMGTLLPTMVFARDMVEDKKGVILNISSMNSYRPLTKIPAYSAAKASINNFTEWLAVHFARTGVRVNGIAPGFFLTKQNKFLLMDEKTGELTDRGKKVIVNTPMGKFGEPDDLQGTALYLLSDVSGFVTGVIIPVDGGFNAYSGV